MPNFSTVWDPSTGLTPKTIHLKYDPVNATNNQWIADINADGAYTVTATVIIDNGVTLEVGNGRTVRFGGQFVCESTEQIFVPEVVTISSVDYYYYGNVYGLRRVRPEWFGAKGDGNATTPTNDSAAFNRAVAALLNTDNFNTRGDALTFELPSRAYYLESELVFPLTAYGKFVLSGSGRSVGGSRLYFKNLSTPMARGVHIKPTSPAVPAEFALKDVMIANLGGCDIPLQIGETGTNYFSSPDYSTVDNVTVEGVIHEGARLPACVEVVNMRHMRWTGLHVITGVGSALRLKAYGVDDSNLRYVADQVFTNTVLENSYAENSIGLEMIASNYAGITGIHMYSTVIYHGKTGLKMTADTNGSIAETFQHYLQIEGSASDNQGTSMHVQCLGSNSHITSTKLTSPWINARTGPNALLFQQNAGYIDGIWIDNADFRDIQKTCARFEGCSGIHITSPNLKNCGYDNGDPAPQAFLFDGSQHFNVTGVTTNNGNIGQYEHVVQVNGLYTDWFNIQITDSNPSVSYVDIDSSNVGVRRLIITPDDATLRSAHLVLGDLPGSASGERLVQVGATDSAGTGYRTVRVPN
ncbi:hypothetical protein PQU92_17195 [Asticcacaulis sp. BYS171W]|uniref:Pectate lyase superfamily protein domain-containing protein n=1 Tax=Asticcacaulis aquaticus TaxID=2984212 RepID=A0ABT5HYA1_9CAUL|nr:hypothetical protein [Asticcacaulis aquaticus]MDC7685024.1 hypothetical protein [Asticcacaulis aquaticus]